ncbi:conserved hypothetical protein [Vibrio crassostreae]|nr:conserved hypothetical protein [Vibrio crassostreae]CAK2893347.1 conserved hypothetical protein [Vibrio crassostreae]
MLLVLHDLQLIVFTLLGGLAGFIAAQNMKG